MPTNEAIIQQSLAEAQRLLDETMVDAALPFLGDILHLTQGELTNIALPDLLLRALETLPKQGSIKNRDGLRILKAVTVLLDQVPNDDPRKQEIIAQAHTILKRLRSRNNRNV